MELLLKKNLENLGEMGEIVDVAPGYARNFLLPKGYAEKLTPGALKRVEALKKKLEEQKTAQRVQLKEMLDQLKSRESFTIMAEADEEGHLYGSVNETMVAALLQEDGFAVEKKHIIIDDPIKTCDIFNIGIRIGEDETQIRLWVVAK